MQINNPAQRSFVVLGEKKTRCLRVTDLKKSEGEEVRVVQNSFSSQTKKKNAIKTRSCTYPFTEC